MKLSLLLVLLLSIIPISIQSQVLKALNSETGKEILFKESKRIRVLTSSGDRISGRFEIVDADHIQIKNQIIALVDLVKVKNNPLLVSIAINGILYYSAAITLLGGLILTAFAGNLIPLIIFLPISGILIYSAIKSPNFLKGYKVQKGWDFSID